MSNPHGGRGKPRATTKDPGKASEEVQSKRVLLVGNEPEICALLARLLPCAGYEVDVASSGYHAWKMMWKRRYAAFILDLRTPDSDGQVLVQHLREVDDLLTRRVIFVTGHTADRAGGDFLTATGPPPNEIPFDLAELQRQLQYMFHNERTLP